MHSKITVVNRNRNVSQKCHKVAMLNRLAFLHVNMHA